MCTKVVHKYACGHEVSDFAPCADKKIGSCSKEPAQKVVPHAEKCPTKCGGKCEKHDCAVEKIGQKLMLEQKKQ